MNLFPIGANASVLRRIAPAAVAVSAMAIGGANLRAESEAGAVPTGKLKKAMKQFVIIFHQGPKPLTEADKQLRSEETRVWAQKQNAAGRKLVPRILEPDGHWIGADGTDGAVPATATGAITALLFLEAHDLAEAVEVAHAHPAIRYGSSVEVRPWAPPPALAPEIRP